MKQTFVPSKVWNSSHSEKGKVIGTIRQSCAGCGSVKEKLIVKWPDGRKTYLCERGVKYKNASTIQIL